MKAATVAKAESPCESRAQVQQDDFIYMAAYCPQFAFATGWGQMRYMVYKDVNRDYEWTL